MKLIDVDSKATLEVFLTLKKRLKLYNFYDNSIFRKEGIRLMPLKDIYGGLDHRW
jgi:hypothetical protein